MGEDEEGGTMSSALERVIAEQQESIDNLKVQLESAQKSSAHVWKQREELFETLAKFLDADIPLDRSDVDRAKKVSQATPRIKSRGIGLRILPAVQRLYLSLRRGCVMDTSNFKEVFESPKVKTLTAQVAALKAENESLRKDAARLDWVEHQDFYDLSFSMLVNQPNDGMTAVSIGEGWHLGNNLREAIDAAMSAELGTQGEEK